MILPSGWTERRCRWAVATVVHIGAIGASIEFSTGPSIVAMAIMLPGAGTAIFSRSTISQVRAPRACVKFRSWTTVVAHTVLCVGTEVSIAVPAWWK